MNILVISYLFPNSQTPDAGIFVLNRLRHLPEGCRIKVINPIPWFPFSFCFKRYKHLSNVPRQETIQGIEVYHPRFFIIPRVLKFIDGLSFILAVLPLALKLRKRFDFQLIDLHWTYPDLPAGSLVSRLTGKKMLVSIRGKEALYLKETSLRRMMIQQGLKKADYVIALSRELAELAEREGADPGRITTIRNGVDLSAFYPVDKALARKRLGLAPDDYILLSVGAMILGKGHDRAIQSLKAIEKTRPGARLYILGRHGPEGDDRKAFGRLVRELDLEDRVVFQGHVPNATLLWWYNAADLFCLFSRSEGSPNVLTEALACGCPCAATRVGAVPEILSSKALGWILPNETRGVLEAMPKIAETDLDREKIADHMKAFGWDWCAQKVFDTYARLMDEG